MSNPGAIHLATSVGGKLKREEVIDAVDKYEKYHGYYGGDEKERKANYADMVLDVGCGIGGPLREIAQFSMTSITGLNNNEYQITRGKLLDRKAGVDKTCDYVKASISTASFFFFFFCVSADFMKMPFPDNSFDAAYAIEATCHAPEAVGCYKEIHRVLKPGQCFAAYEWCMTNSFDPNNKEHQSIKLMVLEWVGLAPKGSQRVQALLEKSAEGLFDGGR
ncbi:hypothetical protein RHSIM_RhsimUnG0121800 [Rhododendron simsii]|uniref:Methyltransferase n=1 Tax=Rhododendron simsii TaxID=118357 RepID=A0A834L4C2_RHOSS|nr:hypothetical protein RHSIM_RhsimUnG0121800 [Rhododendron simsii]